MKNKLLNLIIICFLIGIIYCLQSCENATAIEPNSGDISADDWISPNFTLMNSAGQITGEKIERYNFKYLYINWDIKNWTFENGDIIFYRGAMIESAAIFGSDIAFGFSIPLENNFYWNGVCLYYNGFCYQISQTEDGLRIYNTGLWTLNKYCVIVHASSNLSLPPNAPNTEMLKNIHKIKVRRGHLKAAKMNPNIDGAFTPAGMAWGYYKNHGKEIRPANAGEYIRAEDFIEKIIVGGAPYFKSLTSELQIKNVSIKASGLDCSKVY